MYESIQGTLKDKDPLKAIVETGGIAYRLSIPLSTYTRLPQQEAKVMLYLSQVVREDAHILYAFDAKEERDLFELLLTISGIGPKTALAIVGHMEIGAFQRAVGSSDIRLLSKLPGIGKKTAERLVIEMRDKFKGGARKGKGGPLLAAQGGDSIEADAANALINLGYNPLDAQKAVASARSDKKEETDLGKLITAALQMI
ncbi:MAG: Holliday junction branch migration protein RuvA [Verrucomicrobia bacterium]|nr:Holliday junction branch migration protein RuvA [Verrucomicrobiota bacterium]